jgi:hypothetical protein
MSNTILQNDGKHIERIMTATSCGKHKAGEGLPCYIVNSGVTSNVYIGVCGKRIKKAGFTGSISPTSLALKAPGGRRDARRNKNSSNTSK